MMNEFKIIETEDYVLTVSDEKINDGDCYFNPRTKTILRCNNSNLVAVNLFQCKKVIAYQPTVPKLDIPLLTDMDIETLNYDEKNL